MIVALVVGVVASGVSGSLGVWWGARSQARHDRVERLRGRRTDAAALLIRAWADALFEIDRVYDAGGQPPPEAVQLASDAVTEGVKHHALVELLFGPASPTSTASNLLRQTLRDEVEALRTGAKAEVQRLHLSKATPEMDALVNNASQAIVRTGTDQDPLELDPPRRLRRRGP